MQIKIYNLFIFIVIIFITSCDSSSKINDNIDSIQIDTPVSKVETENLKQDNQDFDDYFLNKFHAVDTGLILIIDGKINKFPNYREVILKLKNNSGKTISAAKFDWTINDAFGKPAIIENKDNKYVDVNGFGFSTIDDLNLKPNKTIYTSFYIRSTNASILSHINVCEIAYTDGTSWSKNSYRN